MRIRTIHLTLTGLALIALSGLLMSCTPDKTAPTLAARTPTPPGDNVQTVADAAIPDTFAVSMPITVPPFTDTECLDCHTNQPLLVELAVEEENLAESLSSGPG